MNREQKQRSIEELKGLFTEHPNFYVVNTESLDTAQTSQLRRRCFADKITFKVAKNTLIVKALQQVAAELPEGVHSAFHGVSALMFCENPKQPAVVLSSFRAQLQIERPVLKIAFVDGALYVGDDQIQVLRALKSREELLGEVVALLQSPVRRVLAALQSGQNTVSGLLTALEKRA